MKAETGIPGIVAGTDYRPRSRYVEIRREDAGLSPDES